MLRSNQLSYITEASDYSRIERRYFRLQCFGRLHQQGNELVGLKKRVNECGQIVLIIMDELIAQFA